MLNHSRMGNSLVCVEETASAGLDGRPVNPEYTRFCVLNMGKFLTSYSLSFLLKPVVKIK